MCSHAWNVYGHLNWQNIDLFSTSGPWHKISVMNFFVWESLSHAQGKRTLEGFVWWQVIKTYAAAPFIEIPDLAEACKFTFTSRVCRSTFPNVLTAYSAPSVNGEESTLPSPIYVITVPWRHVQSTLDSLSIISLSSFCPCFRSWNQINSDLSHVFSKPTLNWLHSSPQNRSWGM